jgi:hypothetical protein
MSIEDSLKRIADSLEKISKEKPPTFTMPKMDMTEVEVPAPKKKKPKAKSLPKAKEAAASAPEPAGDNTVAVTRDDVEDELRKMVRRKDTDKAKEILGNYGASRISEVEESRYGDIMRDLIGANGG